MSLTPSDELIPKDLNDVSSIATMGGLDTPDFAALIQKVLKEMLARNAAKLSKRNAPFCIEFSHLVRQRATEPGVVSAVSSILTRPVVSEEDLHLVSTAMTEVINELSEEDMLSYRPALVTLSETEPDRTRGDAQHTRPLADQARDVLRFMDYREEAWTPGHKYDYMAERSLRERVHTARDMRPHVNGLLHWLQDKDLPPYVGCEAQLARFPEITLMPIREVWRQHRGNGAWINNLLKFIKNHVPVGRSWEVVYPQVNALLGEPVGDEEENDTVGVAAEWIETLKRWRKSQEGLRCA